MQYFSFFILGMYIGNGFFIGSFYGMDNIQLAFRPISDLFNNPCGTNGKHIRPLPKGLRPMTLRSMPNNSVDVSVLTGSKCVLAGCPGTQKIFKPQTSASNTEDLNTPKEFSSSKQNLKNPEPNLSKIKKIEHHQ